MQDHRRDRGGFLLPEASGRGLCFLPMALYLVDMRVFRPVCTVGGDDLERQV